MNWEAVGAIGELIGAIGLFVSIFYLAVPLISKTKLHGLSSVFPLARDCMTGFFKNGAGPKVLRATKP